MYGVYSVQYIIWRILNTDVLMQVLNNHYTKYIQYRCFDASLK